MSDTAVGWTRKSNIDGFRAGTYDVINFWRRGPNIEPMSDIAVYTESGSDRIVIGWTTVENYQRYCDLLDDVIACWPTQPQQPFIKLYIGAK